MGGEMRPLAARTNPKKKRFLFMRPSVAHQHDTCPSTNCHQRLVILIGWNCLFGEAFGADRTEGGRDPKRKCGVLQRGLAVPDPCGR